MKIALSATLTLCASAIPLHAQSVAERGGNIVYTGKNGVTRALTRDGNYEDPALSPDGRTVAFIHIDGKAPSEDEDAPSSLWIADGRTGSARKLFDLHFGIPPQKNLPATLLHPVFSLDGGYVYVMYNASVVSGAVLRISVATGRPRPVIDGNSLSVLRNGRYRGYLLVQRHKYWPMPRAGSYNPVDLVRPDGKVMFTVPGSIEDYGEKSLGRWLRRNGWKAS